MTEPFSSQVWAHEKGKHEVTEITDVSSVAALLVTAQVQKLQPICTANQDCSAVRGPGRLAHPWTLTGPTAVTLWVKETEHITHDGKRRPVLSSLKQLSSCLGMKGKGQEQGIAKGQDEISVDSG